MKREGLMVITKPGITQFIIEIVLDYKVVHILLKKLENMNKMGGISQHTYVLLVVNGIQKLITKNTWKYNYNQNFI